MKKKTSRYLTKPLILKVYQSSIYCIYLLEGQHGLLKFFNVKVPVKVLLNYYLDILYYYLQF